MKKMMIIFSILIYSSVAKASENYPFAWMYINCLTPNIRYVGDILIEFYPDETIRTHFNINDGCLGGRGEGTWNMKNSFFNANFMVNGNDEEQEIAFSLSIMTVLLSTSLGSNSIEKHFSVLGNGEIIDPECNLSGEEKIKFLCFGVCSSEPIRIILH